MQSTASATTTQSELIKNMQPQSAQNMIMTSNKKKKYSQQQTAQPPTKQPQQQTQQSNQLFKINKSFNIVSILKTTPISNQQQQQQSHQQQTVTQSYANIVDRSIPPTICSGGGGNVVTVNNCQINSDQNSTTAIFNLNHRNNNGVIIDENNVHLSAGFVGSSDGSSSGGGGGGCGNNNLSGGVGGGIITLTNSSSHVAGNVIGAAGGGSYLHEKGIVGVNVGCIDNRKYDFKNKLLTNNNYQTAQEYVPSSGTNSTGNVRTNQTGGRLFRGPPSNQDPRSGARHVTMQTMYPQTMHQGVVLPTFTQFPPRQPAFPTQQFSYTQPIQQNYYPYQYYSPIQQQPPQAHQQRGAVGVGVNSGVGVGNAMSVQTGPNGPLTGPPVVGANQAQIPLTAGTVLTSGQVQPGSSTVMGVAAPSGGQQVAVSPMVSVVPTSLPTQPAAQQTTKRRKYAIDIIDPNTNKNIFENMDLSKSSSSSDVDYQDQTSMQATIQPEIPMNAPQEHSSISMGTGVLVITSETRPSIPFNIDLHQVPQQQRDIVVGQTPVVSATAMSDAPSVEILPTKPRPKKIPIVAPKEDQNTTLSALKTSDDIKHHQQIVKNIDDAAATTAKFECVQQMPQHQYQTIQVPQTKQEKVLASPFEEQIEQKLDNTGTINNIALVADGSIAKEQSLTASIANDDPKQINTSDVSIKISRSISISNQQQQQTTTAEEPASISVLSSSTLPENTTDIAALEYTLNNMQLSENEVSNATVAVNVANDASSASKVNNNNNNNNITNGSISTMSKEVPTAIDDGRNNNVVAADDTNSVSNSRLSNLTETTFVVHPKDSVPNAPKELTATTTSETASSDETDRAVLPETSSHPQDTNQIQSKNLVNNENNNNHENGNDDAKDAAAYKMVPPANKAAANAPVTTPAISSAKVSSSETSGTSTTAITTTATSSTTATAAAAPLINYNEGQWSPLNPTGKKQYDREQLMQLREAKASRIQPEVKNVSILPQPNLMPSFVRNTNNNNNAKRVQSMVGSIGGGGNRSGDGGGNSAAGGNFANKQASMSGVHSRGSMKGMGGMIHVNLSLNQDVKLNETDNAWRPRVLNKGADEQDPQVRTKREKDELVRRVRGILNKLTPEKFDALVEEIIKLKIDTPDKMEDVMVLVFEKAIDEPNFSVSYARLCHRLITEVKARDERMESGTKSNLAHFRNALLDKTEREFTQNVTQSAAKEKKLQPIIDRIKKCTDPAEKTELEAQLEEEERKIRRRSGGTVRFIGELFKISMLTGKIIHSCIDQLLNPNSEDMLECMCKLLTTVGAKFEQTAISNPTPAPANARLYSLDKIIARMQAIASKTEGAKVSSRVRFMLQDVIDLRKNKWQSTRNEAPKTMEQIEKETKTAQLSSQYLNYSDSISGGGGGSGSNGSPVAGGSMKRDDRGGGRYNESSRSSGNYSGSHSQRGGGDTGSLRRSQQGGGNNSAGGGGHHSNGNNDDSTWHVQTSKNSRSYAVDTNKLEGLQNLDKGITKMGGLSQFLWANNPSRQSSTPTTTPSNSFAALSALVDSNKSNDRDRNDRGGGPRNKGSYNKGSMERDIYDRGDRGIHSRTGSSSQASRENSSSRGAPAVRGMMNSSSMQKSASHSKYSQQMPSSRMSGKSSGMSSGPSTNYPHRGEQSNSISATPSTQNNQQQPDGGLSSSTGPIAAPVAVFEEPNDSELKIITSVVSELFENAANLKTINQSTVSCINRIKENQRCGFLYYILTEYLHLCNVGQIQRRYLANIVAYLIKQKYISVQHFKLSYEHFCNLASDLIVDIPELWLYIFEFTGPLITKKIISLDDLWTNNLKEDSSSSLGPKFLKTYITYCTREIGPSFTRNMWKNFNMKWTDFVPENDVKNFIQTNKLEYVEDESIQPEIDAKEPREKRINRVVDHIDHLLKEGSNTDCIIDYINGNIVDVDKQFIRSLTTTVCNFAIGFNDGSYKLDIESFQKVCAPILYRYVDSKVERELECLYSMQLLVHSLEHPRGLLNEIFVELYDADIVVYDSFIKWRDSKDQSAGKGVAVKGLNPFFNHIVSVETSD